MSVIPAQIAAHVLFLPVVAWQLFTLSSLPSTAWDPDPPVDTTVTARRCARSLKAEAQAAFHISDHLVKIAICCGAGIGDAPHAALVPRVAPTVVRAQSFGTVRHRSRDCLSRYLARRPQAAIRYSARYAGGCRRSISDAGTISQRAPTAFN